MVEVVKSINPKKLPTYCFVLGVIVSVSVPLIFFKSLNRCVHAKHMEANSANDGLIYYVDQCDYVDGSIKLRGWASPVDGYGQVLAFAELDGKEVQLRTSIEDRPDVSAFMKKPELYDRSGFVSSLHVGKGIKKITIFLQVKKNEKVYVVKHECK